MTTLTRRASEDFKKVQNEKGKSQSQSENERPKPRRIQRQRTKGWHMPANCVYVGRPTRFGNPYKVGELVHPDFPELVISPSQAVRLYARLISNHVGLDSPLGKALEALRGKDLACWCPLDIPCHADVLLQAANRNASEDWNDGDLQV